MTKDLKALAKGSRKSRADESVMGTNNSSIVSKRSVERLYYPEPYFFRYFVKKPIRRSPLINRGYWLRMRAIDVVVERFLESSDPRHKIIINLGCGYDPLPFQWLSKLPASQNVTFVDIDFPSLIAKKADLVRSTPSLCKLLHLDPTNEYNATLELRAKNYAMLGCDLADTAALERKLQAICPDTADTLILCIAEVSVTYMDVKAADRLIQWAAEHKNLQMCILEQFLPDGPDHPFAKKMIAHFNNLGTPLQSLPIYPSLNHQIRRFESLGWPAVFARSLWDIWCDGSWVSQNHRQHVDAVEPFDEWEEFILFASHYFLLQAGPRGFSSVSTQIERPLTSFSEGISANGSFTSLNSSLRCEFLDPIEPRRFGSAFNSGSGIAYFGGIGEQSRVNTTARFDIREEQPAGTNESTPSDVPNMEMTLPVGTIARSSQALASTENGRHLITGGRASPDKPLQDAFYFDQQWRRVHDLPQPLYRHCMSWVRGSEASQTTNGVLLYGGKTLNNHIVNDWRFWQEGSGWHIVAPQGVPLEPTFGASMISLDHDHGLLIGGLTHSGLLKSEVYSWKIAVDGGRFIVSISKINFLNWEEASLLTRYGAQAVRTKAGTFVIGGVSNRIQSRALEVIKVSPPNQNEGSWSAHGVSLEAPGRQNSYRALFVGHSVIQNAKGVFVIGGGAVCFSFGTYWSQRPLVLSEGNIRPIRLHRHASRPGKQIIGSASHSIAQPVHLEESTQEDDTGKLVSRTLQISRVKLSDQEHFRNVLAQRLPVIIEGLELGPCGTSWSVKGLKTKIGESREIIAHVSRQQNMDFLEKNFDYVRKPFGLFMDEIGCGSKQYLRSIASLKPADQAANIDADFPELAKDFLLPEQLKHILNDVHSSVLRISGPVRMWLHYDVMANVLCQIGGSKRLLLYPPSDVSHLNVPAGASSSSTPVFDVDADIKFPSLRDCHPHEAVLNPGDILFIPPLWLHAASPLENVSVAVNVFFRDLAGGYAPGKDVYANRDLQAYETGRRSLAKIVKSFEGLPGEMAGFYLARLSDELRRESRRVSSGT